MKQINETPTSKKRKCYIKPKKNETTCELGGIIQYSHGYGFKVSFKGNDATEKAQHYKDMFKWILQSDKIKVTNGNGYYDRKD